MNQIQCPKCSHAFTINDAVNAQMKEQLASEKQKLEQEKSNMRDQMTAYNNQKDKDYQQKLAEFETQKKELEAKTKLETQKEYNAKLLDLQTENDKKGAKLQALELQELNLLRHQAELEKQQKNLEIEVEKRILQSTKQIELAAIEQVQQQNNQKLQEKDTQLESLKKNLAELQRKTEQGSMQIQGEAQELLLEQLLKETFKYDRIVEIGKGVKGADCVHTVCSSTGKECGTIIYESKNAKAWSNDWVEKLKTDKRNSNHNVAILVTQVFPKGITRFTEIDGVWVCNYKEVISLAHVLRSSIMQVHAMQAVQENKGDKMVMLYNFLTSTEFKSHLEAIMEGFISMKETITKERTMMEKNWKEREKLSEKVLLNISGLYGSLRGIAGSSIRDIPLLEG